MQYHNEHDTVEKIIDEQPLGMVNLIIRDFKKTILPSPTHLLQVTEAAIPK